jgi:ribosome-associated translation inhibitor RaiA
MSSSSPRTSVRRAAGTFGCAVDLTVPGGEVVVSHAPGDDATNEDAYAAVDEAFDRLGRRLEDHGRRQRGDVKPRGESYREGRVSKLWSYEGYGFIEAPDGARSTSIATVFFTRRSTGSRSVRPCASSKKSARRVLRRARWPWSREPYCRVRARRTRGEPETLQPHLLLESERFVPTHIPVGSHAARGGQ